MTAPSLSSVPASYYDPAAQTWTTVAPDVEAAIQCTRCGQPLVRLDSGWMCNTCPVIVQKIIDDAVIRERLEAPMKAEVMRKVAEQTEKTLNFLRVRSQWAGRFGVVAGVAGEPASATAADGAANGKPARKSRAKKPAAESTLPPPVSE